MRYLLILLIASCSSVESDIYHEYTFEQCKKVTLKYNKGKGETAIVLPKS